MPTHDAQAIARRWLEDREISVAVRRLSSYLGLVSPKLHVYGLPDRPELDFASWMARCTCEWPQLQRLRYEGLRLKNAGLRRIGFLTREVRQTLDGRELTLDKEIILEHEEDGVWRAVEETLTPVARPAREA